MQVNKVRGWNWTGLSAASIRWLEEWKQDDGLLCLFAGEVGGHSVASISVQIGIDIIGSAKSSLLWRTLVGTLEITLERTLERILERTQGRTFLFRECQSVRKRELSILWSCLLLVHVVAHTIRRQGSSQHPSPQATHLTRWGWSWQLWATAKGKRTQSWILISGGD